MRKPSQLTMKTLNLGLERPSSLIYVVSSILTVVIDFSIFTNINKIIVIKRKSPCRNLLN